MKILVITSKPDPHVEMVQRYLTCDLLVVDPRDYPTKTITYLWEPPHFRVYWGDESLQDVRAIWYRKPILYRPEEIEVLPIYQGFAHSAYEHTIKAIYALMRSRLWVSDPWAVLKGNNKLYQIELAHALGFKIPRTIVTSDPIQAAAFLSRKRRFITKPMTTESVQIGDKTYMMYTSRVGSNVDMSGLPLSPAIFQEEIANAYDVRVTVIGNKVFACEIHKTGSMTSEVDWRRGNFGGELVYKPCELDFEDQCIRLIQQMGLKFGALDFIRDTEGEYWFIEINPNGQWGFIEKETELPLAKTMAELLQGNQT